MVLERNDGPRPSQELQPVGSTSESDADGYHEEIRQILRPLGQELRQSFGRSHHGRYRAAAKGSLEFPVRRGHVVPGFIQLRLSAKRYVYYFILIPTGRDYHLRRIYIQRTMTDLGI